MKKAIFALAVAALGCGSLGAQNYLIEGTAADMDGKKVYIGELRSKKRYLLRRLYHYRERTV